MPLPLYGSGLRTLRTLGGELADGLLVGAGHVDLVDAFELHRHVRRGSPRVTVGVADRQHEVLALLLGLVADALDFQRLLVAVGHAFDHVRQQRAGQAVQRLALLLVVGAGDDQVAVLRWLDLDQRVHVQLELALGALDGDVLVLDRDLRLADGDGFFSDSAHDFTSSADMVTSQADHAANR